MIIQLIIIILITILISYLLFMFKKEYEVYLLLVPVCLSISYFDYKLLLIPDRFHVLSLVIIISIYWLTGAYSFSYFDSVVFLGMLLALMVSRILYRKIRKKDGLGMGDVKLIVWVSLLVKYNILSLIVFSCFTAVLFQLFKKIINNSGASFFPFAPYLLSSLYIEYLLR